MFKKNYEEPCSEILIVRFEDGLCGSPLNPVHQNQKTEYILGGTDEDYDEL